MTVGGIAVLLFWGSGVAYAEENVVEWLGRAVKAAHQYNYEGVVAYYQEQHIEISKIAHYVRGDDEYQRMESLNGPLRKTIRMNNMIRCYIPDAKTVRVMPNTLRNVFPGLKANNINTLTEHYLFSKAESERLAGREAQAVIFIPKDNFRYAHKLWLDKETGLLLAGHLIDPKKQEALERFAFMEIEFTTLPDGLNMSWPEVPADWKVERMGIDEAIPVKTKWRATQLPPGFFQIAEEQRHFANRPEPVTILVYSDGLIAVSVFIEKASGSSTVINTGDIDLGFLTAYKRKDNDRLITVVGRAPHDTLRLIAQGIAHK